MRGRKPDRFVLKRKDKVTLQELLCDGHTSLCVARRAQILLYRAAGQQQGRVKALGERVAQDTATIWRVCERCGEVVLAVDEKPNLQVLQRAAPKQPMRPGQMAAAGIRESATWHAYPAGWPDLAHRAHAI